MFVLSEVVERSMPMLPLVPLAVIVLEFRIEEEEEAR
jgi:hypothetical protein